MPRRRCDPRARVLSPHSRFRHPDPGGTTMSRLRPPFDKLTTFGSRLARTLALRASMISGSSAFHTFGQPAGDVRRSEMRADCGKRSRTNSSQWVQLWQRTLSEKALLDGDGHEPPKGIAAPKAPLNAAPTHQAAGSRFYMGIAAPPQHPKVRFMRARRFKPYAAAGMAHSGAASSGARDMRRAPNSSSSNGFCR
jgi:hypothetical protein